MMKLSLESLSHRAFQIGIILKALDGVLETVSGAALLLTSHPEIQRAVAFLVHNELVEDPQDFFANLLMRMVRHLSASTQNFAGFYLLGHGIIKIGLAIGLLRGALWSYPTALVLLVIFIIYQAYRLFNAFSLFLCLLTIVDTVIVLLIWREWQHAKETQSAPTGSSQC